jgi:probable HAF family extracellular repeat protein
MVRTIKGTATRRALLVACAVAAMTAPAAAQTYRITDLGTLGGTQSEGVAINSAGAVAGNAWTSGNAEQHSFVWRDGIMTDVGSLGGWFSSVGAMNAAGQVTGWAYTASGEQRAFLFSNGVMTDLGHLGAGISAAAAINASGDVVGWSSDFPNSSRAFWYSGGVMTDLGTLGGSASAATGINASGQITGFARTRLDAATHAFLYQDGVMSDLGTLGGTFSRAVALNANGQVTGESFTAGNAASHAFLYSNGVMIDLGTLGGQQSIGTAINDAGEVIGTSTTASGDTHAFVYSGGVMRDLGTLGPGFSAPTSINSAGQVTGYWYPPGVQGSGAFLYTNGALVDLNALIPSDSGWFLSTANAINDRGEIVGQGQIGLEFHAFLLTPVDVTTRAAAIEQPIDADGSSVFNAKRGVIPVRFTLTENGAPTCQLPPATISVARIADGVVAPIVESLHQAMADEGTDFRVSDCQYIYNLSAASLGVGRYRVTISIDGVEVGRAEFSLR